MARSAFRFFAAIIPFGSRSIASAIDDVKRLLYLNLFGVERNAPVVSL